MIDTSAARRYPPEALRRLLDEQDVEIVNGSPVEIRSATDLAPGHLDPFLLDHQKRRDAEGKRPGLATLVRDLVGIALWRDKTLLRGRAALHAAMTAEQKAADLTSGDVEITRHEWTLAGEVRPVWRFARDLPDSGPRPVFLHLHGGAFSAGTPTGHDPVLKIIADQSDAVVFDLDYSMIPERTFPQPVHEAVAAIEHIRANAADWGLDPSRVAVGGGSAGGNLSAATAMMARDHGIPLALQVLFNPFVHFGRTQKGFTFVPVAVVEQHRRFAGPQKDPMPGFLVTMLYKTYGGGADRLDPYLSPALAADLSGLAPLLLINSEMDPLHQSAEHFAGDLARAGVPVRAIRYRGVLHDTVAMVATVPHGEAAAMETAAAIRALP